MYIISHLYMSYRHTMYMYVYTDINGRVCGALAQFGCYQHRHQEGKGICGALVQFGCYQHGYEWKGLWYML